MNVESVKGKDNVSSLELVFVHVFRKTSHGVSEWVIVSTDCIEVSAILSADISFIPSLSTHVTGQNSMLRARPKGSQRKSN